MIEAPLETSPNSGRFWGRNTWGDISAALFDRAEGLGDDISIIGKIVQEILTVAERESATKEAAVKGARSRPRRIAI